MPKDEGGKYTFETVSEILKGYKGLKRTALQLEFEINNYIPIATGEDIIEAMTFGKPEDDSIGFLHKGNSSDKTAKIAVSYADKSARLNSEYRRELVCKLRQTQAEILRIEYYISILDRKQAAVLSKLYLEEKTFVDAAKELSIAVTTLKNYRKVGISKLTEMFNVLSE